MMRNLLFSAMIAGLAFGSGAANAAVSAFPAAPSQTSVSAAHAGTRGPLRWFTEQPGAAASKTPYGNNPSVGHTVQAGDAKIYYEIYGTPETGTPVFVFHGGGVGVPYEMGTLIDHLRPNHEVIVVSTRGHGRSEIGHSPLTYEQKGRDMLAVMHAVPRKPAMIIGFSDGAYTAYEAAKLEPKAVDRIVAIGAGTLKPGYFKPGLKVSDLRKIDNAFVEQQLKLMPEPGRWQEFLTNYMNFWSRMSVGAETFKAVKAPVLLIVGDEDDHAPVITVLEAHQMLPNSRLCVVPKAWHTAFIDNFPVTWAAIHPFIEADHKALVSSKKLPYNNR